jgi:SAM-dependent methyltransferase
MSKDDRELWERRYVEPATVAAPASFLRAHAALLPAGLTLELAAGSGRNAHFLADRGHRVVAVDVARGALARLRATDPRVACVCMDLDVPGFRAASVDVVIIVNFLDRRLFAALPHWLRAGGVLLWDTFLVEQREIGHPRNPDFLLQRGELARRLGDGFDFLAVREGLVEDTSGRAFRSGVVARRRGR